MTDTSLEGRAKLPGVKNVHMETTKGSVNLLINRNGQYESISLREEGQVIQIDLTQENYVNRLSSMAISGNPIKRYGIL